MSTNTNTLIHFVERHKQACLETQAQKHAPLDARHANKLICNYRHANTFIHIL